MTNDKKTELKMILFEKIGEVKNGTDIAEAQMEAEYFFRYCEILSDVDRIGDSSKDMLIQDNIDEVISTYDLRPDLSFEDRVPFVKGVLFTVNMYPTLMCDPKFEQLSVESKLAKLIMAYDQKMKNNNNTMSEEFNIYKGIAMKLEVFEHSDNKGNNGQNRKK